MYYIVAEKVLGHTKTPAVLTTAKFKMFLINYGMLNEYVKLEGEAGENTEYVELHQSKFWTFKVYKVDNIGDAFEKVGELMEKAHNKPKVNALCDLEG